MNDGDDDVVVILVKKAMRNLNSTSHPKELFCLKLGPGLTIGDFQSATVVIPLTSPRFKHIKYRNTFEFYGIKL